MPALRARRRADPPEPRRRRAATASSSGPTRTSTTCSAWRPTRAYLSCERIVPTADLLASGPPQSLLINRAMVDGVVETPGGAHFTSCVPDYGRDEAFQREYAAAAAESGRLAAFRAAYLAGDEAGYQEAVQRFTRARAAGCAEAGEPPMSAERRRPGPSLRGRVRRGLARRRRDPGQPDGHDPDARAPGWPGSPSRPTCCSPTARPIAASAPGDARRSSRAGCPYRAVFTIVAAGRRHVMMGARQLDRFGNQNISCIGDWARPKAQLLGVRGAPGNTINHPVSYWVPRHSPRVFVEQVDMVSGVGYDRAAGAGGRGAALPRAPRGGHQPGRARLRDPGPRDAAALGASRASRVDEVVEATGFELVVPADVPDTRRADRRRAGADPRAARPGRAARDRGGQP